MKINGRKLKDRGDDLAVIFPARLQWEKLAWRWRRFFLRLLHFWRFTVIIKFTRPGVDWYCTSGMRLGRWRARLSHQKPKPTLMSINSLILPFTSPPPLHSVLFHILVTDIEITIYYIQCIIYSTRIRIGRFNFWFSRLYISPECYREEYLKRQQRVLRSRRHYWYEHTASVVSTE